MVAIIDYKAGNLTSVHLALESLGIPSKITRDRTEIIAADRVVFPGDGAAQSAMKHLEELELLPVVKEVVENGTPFLGICIGTQIIMETSEENNGVDCIGLIPGSVTRFSSKNPFIKIPQMGWNTVNFRTKHPLFAEIENESEFYFIHSYYPVPKEPEFVFAETEYADVTFPSIIGKENVIATQFHPERSGRIGLLMLKNFCNWDGKC